MRSNLIVISLDYDDCGDILFDDHLSTFTDEIIRKRVVDYKAFFRNYLYELTKDKNAELYVGSARQTPHLDFINMQEHKNGLCFKNYEDLAMGMHWKFNKFLYSDRNESAGALMDGKYFVVWFACPPKSLLIEAQLNNISKEHPDKSIDFYFFDDNAENTILSTISNHLQNIKIPKNIANIHLVKHDWVPFVYYDIKDNTIVTYKHIINISTMEKDII